VEIEGADHREILRDDVFLFHILNLACYGKLHQSTVMHND